VTEHEIGRLIRELHESREESRAAHEQSRQAYRELKRDMRSQHDALLSRVILLENGVEELRRRDREQDALLDTGRQDVESVRERASQIEEALAEQREALDRQRRQHVALATALGVGGGAGVSQLVQVLVQMLGG
jgi:phosphomevalonate kinase